MAITRLQRKHNKSVSSLVDLVRAVGGDVPRIKEAARRDARRVDQRKRKQFRLEANRG